MKDNSTTIQWLKAIRSQFEKREHFFDVKKCDAIDDAISALERRVDPCEDKYVDGYIKGVEVAAKEYEAEIKKLIDEKDYLKRRLNDIYSTASFKAAQVYDGRLERLEESVNDLRSKVNTMSWDRCYYGIKPLDIYDLPKMYLNEKPADCFKTLKNMTVEECREEAKRLFNDSLNNYVNLKTVMDARYVGHIDAHHDLNEKIDELDRRINKFRESDDLRYDTTLEARSEIHDRIDELEYRIKKLEEK